MYLQVFEVFFVQFRAPSTGMRPSCQLLLRNGQPRKASTDFCTSVPCWRLSNLSNKSGQLMGQQTSDDLKKYSASRRAGEGLIPCGTHGVAPKLDQSFDGGDTWRIKASFTKKWYPFGGVTNMCKQSKSMYGHAYRCIFYISVIILNGSS